MAQRGLTRRDPLLSEIWDVRRSFDDFFSRFFNSPWSGEPVRERDWLPAVECYVDKNRYHVRVALPGIESKDVNVQVHGNELMISGKREQTGEISDDRYLRREFVYGNFERTVALPEGVEADKVKARFENGVLEVEAPISEKALPKQIQVETVSEGKRIAA